LRLARAADFGQMAQKIALRQWLAGCDSFRPMHHARSNFALMTCVL
jgi:hypothetical protein